MALDLVLALIQICKETLTGVKGLKAIADDKFSDREREILVAGAKQGLFQVILCNSVPVLFENGTGRTFADDSHAGDPAITAHYLEAFRRLCHRGLVVPIENELFTLTGTGFEIARQFAKELHGIDIARQFADAKDDFVED